MKMVEFTRDMRPHKAGETRVVPDAVADRLIAAGDAKPRDSVFDKPAPGSERGPDEPPTGGSAAKLGNGAERAGGRPYPTRKRGG